MTDKNNTTVHLFSQSKKSDPDWCKQHFVGLEKNTFALREKMSHDIRNKKIKMLNLIEFDLK